MVDIKYDTAILSGGHALIIGHKPDKLSLSQIQGILKDNPQSLEQLGLFDTSTPNYSTYYPEVTAEDLIPSDSEFIEPVFRMLSNITVHAEFNPIYFPKEVLKRTMGKMVGQTINIDHEKAIGNAIGTVKSVEWQESYTSKGIKVPAGFNAVLKIDGKSNPRIARGIMMDPPSIHANSVTVHFAWIKSHPKMDDNDFFAKLGTYGKDGKLIQRVVSDIISYYETSLVSHGADPFAQKVDENGNIVKPESAKSRYPLSAKNITSNGDNYYYTDWKSFSDDETNIHNNIHNNNYNSEKMEDLFRFLETQLGLEENSLTEESYEGIMIQVGTELTGLRSDTRITPEEVSVLDLTGIDNITAEVTRLRGVESSLPEDLKDKLAAAETIETITQELRDDTIRLYKLSIEEGKEDATILAMFNTSDYNMLKSLHKQYDELTEGKFGFTCIDCGSNNVTKASAQPADPNTTDGFTERTLDEAMENLTSINRVDTSLFSLNEEAD